MPRAPRAEGKTLACGAFSLCPTGTAEGQGRGVVSGAGELREVVFGGLVVAGVFVPATSIFDSNICAREKQPPPVRGRPRAVFILSDRDDRGPGKGVVSGAGELREVVFGGLVVAGVFVPATSIFVSHICAREKQPPPFRGRPRAVFIADMGARTRMARRMMWGLAVGIVCSMGEG